MLIPGNERIAPHVLCSLGAGSNLAARRDSPRIARSRSVSGMSIRFLARVAVAVPAVPARPEQLRWGIDWFSGEPLHLFELGAWNIGAVVRKVVNRE
jgi:hypothetical protein